MPLNTPPSEGFNWIARPDAVLLILGSFPSEASLGVSEYYANPRNAFWRIMLALAGVSPEPWPDYEARLEILAEAKIALWDVLGSCRRPGSLDSSIEPESARLNDFRSLLDYCPSIKHVFFNGQSPQKRYNRLAPKNGTCPLSNFEHHVLPSTSPAFASWSFERKLQSWRKLEVFTNF